MDNIVYRIGFLSQQEKVDPKKNRLMPLWIPEDMYNGFKHICALLYSRGHKECLNPFGGNGVDLTHAIELVMDHYNNATNEQKLEYCGHRYLMFLPTISTILYESLSNSGKKVVIFKQTEL